MNPGRRWLTTLGTLGLLAGTAAAQSDLSTVARQTPASDVPRGLLCLWHAYPEHLCQVKANALVWCDGTEMVYDTGREHPTHDDLLNRPDLQDMMVMPYPTGSAATPPPAVNVEPGRVRYEPLFRKMYGDSHKAVSRRTAKVTWLDGKRVRVTTVNGVNEHLQAVLKALRALPAAERKVVEKTAGTLNWRKIRGTPRQSMHSFAVAIDAGVPNADYWKWSKRRNADGSIVYRNRIPMAVVEAFERHGFIWGGRWYHHDTMHFEYRPELLHPLCTK